jgi:uncharacterized protein VirK/YbjX
VVGRTQLLSSRKLLKRVKQVFYLSRHPVRHYRCATTIRDSQLTSDPLISLKYLGDHLALSLGTPQRQQALMGHYAALPQLLHPDAGGELADGMLVWRRELEGQRAPLSIFLEPSKLAPMEGELQLRFSFRSDLFVLTFLIAPGRVFGLDCSSIVFIGGVQGRIGSKEEMREASRLNDEISPAAMLILAVQAIAKIMRVDDLIAIAEDDHISMGYSPSKIMFDYRRLWTEAGGERFGAHYRIPIEPQHKPIAEIALTHRSRTKRKRAAKKRAREEIELRLLEIVMPALEPAHAAGPLPLLLD